MQNIPGLKGIPGVHRGGFGFKLIILLIIVAIAVYLLAQYGIINLPFKLPF